jgi:hypothetical protein
MAMRNRTCFLAAGLLVALLLPPAASASPCTDSIVGKIAWDGQKNMHWTQANLDRLCRGAESSTEPGACFRQLMTSNAVSWGGGTKWNPDNAVRLCAGATRSQQRISCFQSAIKSKLPWQQASDQCQGPPAQVAQPARQAVPAATPSSPSSPAATASGGGETVDQAKQFAKGFTCKGPLELEYLAADPRASAEPHQFVVKFVGAESAANVQPGQCWRSGGWSFPTGLPSGRAGRLLFSFPLGACPLFQSMKVSGGRVTEFTMTTQGRGGEYATRLFNAASKPGATLNVDAKFLFGANAGTEAATYRVTAPDGDIFTPERCK